MSNERDGIYDPERAARAPDLHEFRPDALRSLRCAAADRA